MTRARRFVCGSTFLGLQRHAAYLPAFIPLQCKFSHDKNIGRKTEKKNLYTDDREGVANPGAVDPNDKKLDTMDTWDDDKLAKVVLSKAGNPKTSTDIVCKYFIQAIEDQKYGWFWECVRPLAHSISPVARLDADYARAVRSPTVSSANTDTRFRRATCSTRRRRRRKPKPRPRSSRLRSSLSLRCVLDLATNASGMHANFIIFIPTLPLSARSGTSLART